MSLAQEESLTVPLDVKSHMIMGVKLYEMLHVGL